MLPNPFFSSLEAALNRYLRLDPESSKRLRQLEGKTIGFQLAFPAGHFQLHIEKQAVQLSGEKNASPDVIIRGRPLGLLALALMRDKKKGFALTDVSLEGNAEVGQQVLDLFAKLEIDWEEYLSHWLGDSAAHGLGRVSQGLRAWGKEAKASCIQNTTEYLHEEKRWFPPAEAMQDFLREVDELRMDLDRLEARAVRLLADQDEK